MTTSHTDSCHEAILVSACLLGSFCRYDGARKTNPEVQKLAECYRLIPVCPEVMGGLPVPRTPSEIQGDRVVMKDGKDVTAEYQKGAEMALAYAHKYHCRYAVLKARSPSCGSGMVYDGTFSGTMKPGDGITARVLKKHGITVLTEEEILGRKQLHD